VIVLFNVVLFEVVCGFFLLVVSSILLSNISAL